jgi:hypothetical protein
MGKQDLLLPPRVPKDTVGLRFFETESTGSRPDARSRMVMD